MPFRDLTGHRALLALLARAVARDTLPPSLIFAGPEGVGKRHVAVALAQALNCHDPIGVGAPGGKPQGRAAPGASRPFELDACGTCPACRRIERGVHADVLRVGPGETGSIRIDQVREVIDRAAYRPFEGRRRVVIVDEADALVHEAQNALLKTLEEPPPASVFVLVTARPDTLLPTVRSRCPRLRFGRLGAAEMAAILIERHGLSEADARASAAAADGSLGRALLERSGALVDARESAERVLHEAAASADPRRRLDAARDLAGKDADREVVTLRLRALASLLRDLGLLAARAADGLLANADLKRDLERLAKAYDGDRALRAFSAVDRALEALERNASPKVVADWLVLQL